MSKIVDFFAEKDNLAVWHNEFLDSYKKMASNKNQNLETSNREFMSHTCELWFLKLLKICPNTFNFLTFISLFKVAFNHLFWSKAREKNLRNLKPKRVPRNAKKNVMVLLIVKSFFSTNGTEFVNCMKTWIRKKGKWEVVSWFMDQGPVNQTNKLVAMPMSSEKTICN